MGKSGAVYLASPCGLRQVRPALPDIQIIGKTGLFLVLLLRARDHIGTGKPAVQVDIPAAWRAERQRWLLGRLAADRALLRLAARAGPACGFNRWH